MTKRKTQPEDIRNPEYYFNRYVAKEVQHELAANSAYYDQNISLEDMLGENGDRISNENLSLLAVNRTNEFFEQHISDSSLLGWIEMIENPTLHSAIRSLSLDDQILLTYRFHYCLTQAQTAEFLHISQAKVSYQECRIKKFVQDFFRKVAKKS